MIAILRLAEHLVGPHEKLGKQKTDLSWPKVENELKIDLNISETDIAELKSIAEENGIGVS